MSTSPYNRILAIHYCAHGLGYAVLEKARGLVVFGNRRICRDKNATALAQIERWLERYQSDAIVLAKVNTPGTRHSVRVRRLHRSTLSLAKRNGVQAVEISAGTLRNAILGRATGTKQEVYEAVARRFPIELGKRVPPPRKLYESEDSKVGAFEAVALGLSVSAPDQPGEKGGSGMIPPVTSPR